MPTALPRIQVTVTRPLADALALAETRWPKAPKSELLTHLATLGSSVLEQGSDKARQERRQAIESTMGALKDAYPQGYLASLREDWPQ